MTRAGRMVDPARIVDAMEVAQSAPLAPPRYSLEILRNDRGISLIGLVPEKGGRAALERGLSGFDDVTDLLGGYGAWTGADQPVVVPQNA